jgi:hypothetical protein
MSNRLVGASIHSRRRAATTEPSRPRGDIPESCVPQYAAAMREALCHIDAIIESHPFLKEDGSSMK